MKIKLPGNYTLSTSGIGFSLDKFTPAHTNEKGDLIKASVKNISYPSSLKSGVERWSMLYNDTKEYNDLKKYVEAINELTEVIKRLGVQDEA